MDLYVFMLYGLARRSFIANIAAIVLVPYGYYVTADQLFNALAPGNSYRYVGNTVYTVDKMHRYIGNIPEYFVIALILAYMTSALQIKLRERKPKT